jgi:hypothetical protein
MAKVLQFRRDTTSGISTVTGAEGELFVDLTKDTLVVMDGTTQGGQALQKELIESSNITVGIITASSAFFSGNVSIAGTLTYEDVTSVDAIGLVTARSGVRITAGGIDVIGVTTVRNALTQDGIIISGRAGGTSTYAVTVVPTTLSASRTLTLPDATTTLVGTDTTQTLTSKTLSSATLTGSLTAGGGTGSNGQVLQSTGSGVQWATAGGGDPTVTTSSTNSAFKVPFANTTTSTTGNYGLLQDTEATFTYNPSSNTLIAGTFSGSGASLTSIPNSATTATNTNTASAIVARDGSGNFSAGTITAALTGTATTATNSTVTTSSTNSAFKIPFANTTANTTGNYGLLQDSETTFTYNPSSNTLIAGTFSGSGASLTSLNASNLSSGTVPGDRGVTSGSSSSSFVEYNGTTKTAGQFDGGTTNPTNTTRLNYDGYLYATRFYGDGSQLTGVTPSLTSVSSDILPSVDGVYDLGSITNKWYDLFVSNGINFGSSVTLSLTGGYLNLNADLVTQDLTSTSALVGDVLISTNIITPDKGGYDEGELIVDGNLDVQGDYLNVPLPLNKFVGSETWVSGGSLSTGRRENASAGTMTAALTFGGRISAFVFTNTSEEYNGTSWSSGGNLPQTRYNHGGNGTQTAALSVGGSSTNVYEYDGTSWTSGGTYPNDKVDGIRSAGSQTAAVAFGGSSTFTNLTYEYDGTSWSSGGNLITSRANHGGGGTQTAALAFGGSTIGAKLSSTEEYNGTTWSSTGSLSQVNSNLGGASNNSLAEPIAISAGGETDPSNKVATTEKYDGSLWTAASNLPFITSLNSCTGSSEGFLSIGGDKTTGGFYLSDTYELIPANIISDAAGNKGQIRFNVYTSKFEGYDGTSWVVFNP